MSPSHTSTSPVSTNMFPDKITLDFEAGGNVPTALAQLVPDAIKTSPAVTSLVYNGDRAQAVLEALTQLHADGTDGNLSSRSSPVLESIELREQQDGEGNDGEIYTPFLTQEGQSGEEEDGSEELTSDEGSTSKRQ